MKAGRWAYSIVVVVVFFFLYNLQDLLVRFPAYRRLYHSHSFLVPEGLKTSLEILLCLLATALALRGRFHQVWAELRLNRGFARGVLFGVIATVPFAIGLAATHRTGKIAWPELAYLCVFAPFAEELVVRAYGFGQLHRRCGWPVWLAIAVTAVVFGWGHVEKGSSFSEAAALFVITGVGGAFAAWFYYRWDSIWFPFTIHVLMNLYWEIFSVSRIAIGGWWPFALQWITLLFAAWLTWRQTRNQVVAGAAQSA